MLADLVVALHSAFVVFVAIGGLMVLRWPRLAWLHLPAAVWGALIEFTGAVCPLTPLEKWLRASAGESVYEGGFIAHYMLPLLYPDGLTRGHQVVLGTAAVAVNAAIYGWLLLRRRRGARESG